MLQNHGSGRFPVPVDWGGRGLQSVKFYAVPAPAPAAGAFRSCSPLLLAQDQHMFYMRSCPSERLAMKIYKPDTKNQGHLAARSLHGGQEQQIHAPSSQHTGSQALFLLAISGLP